MGKTAFCLNIAQYAAIEKGTPVAIFFFRDVKGTIGHPDALLGGAGGGNKTSDRLSQ